MRRGPLYLAAAVALLAVLGIALHAWSRDDPDPPPRRTSCVTPEPTEMPTAGCWPWRPRRRGSAVATRRRSGLAGVARV